MKKKEFMENMGITYFNGVYCFSYRNKTILQYMRDVEKNGVEPKLHEECVKFFKELDLDISDGFEINIIFLGRMEEDNEPVFSIYIKNQDGIIFNIIFKQDIISDDVIDLLVDSLCKAMYLKCYREVNVKFMLLWNNSTFDEYYNEYIKEVG